QSRGRSDEGERAITRAVCVDGGRSAAHRANGALARAIGCRGVRLGPAVFVPGGRRRRGVAQQASDMGRRVWRVGRTGVPEDLKIDAEPSESKRKLGTAWATTVFSAVALLFSAYSLWESRLKQSDLRVFVPSVI